MLKVLGELFQGALLVSLGLLVHPIVKFFGEDKWL